MKIFLSPIADSRNCHFLHQVPKSTIWTKKDDQDAKSKSFSAVSRVRSGENENTGKASWFSCRSAAIVLGKATRELPMCNRSQPFSIRSLQQTRKKIFTTYMTASPRKTKNFHEKNSAAISLSVLERLSEGSKPSSRIQSKESFSLFTRICLSRRNSFGLEKLEFSREPKSNRNCARTKSESRRESKLVLEFAPAASYL